MSVNLDHKLFVFTLIHGNGFDQRMRKVFIVAPDLAGAVRVMDTRPHGYSVVGAISEKEWRIIEVTPCEGEVLVDEILLYR